MNTQTYQYVLYLPNTNTKAPLPASILHCIQDDRVWRVPPRPRSRDLGYRPRLSGVK